ncbi:MAG: NAD(+)/NADH kinase [Candidatus Brennerbacteria bacterium]|nr:NAD(+)/NADH kinase [Candidatus Brennerbacteria bacterium]
MKRIFLVKNEVLGVSNVWSFIDYLHLNTKIVNNIKDAEVILVIGGDGTMLKAIRKYQVYQLPFVGLNFGHVGFLMNKAEITIVDEIINNHINFIDNIRMLKAEIYDQNEKMISEELAFNDFYFERTTSQTAKFQIKINNEIKFESLISDGIIVSTPAGSTAYNASAGGIILPIDSNLMIITAICPAIFHNWRTALLSSNSLITVESIETDKRPVRFLADGYEIKNALKAKISYSDSKVILGFAKSNDFREKVVNFQFFKTI